MECPNCKVEMIRRKSKYGKGFWWGCKNYPDCKITSAEHPDGSVMSTPADQETKDLRSKAHRISEGIWGKWDSPKCQKREMYNWLEHNTKSGHFGKMDKEELKTTIEKLETTLAWKDI